MSQVTSFLSLSCFWSLFYDTSKKQTNAILVDVRLCLGEDRHTSEHAYGSEDKLSRFSSEVVSAPLFFQDKVSHLLGNHLEI